MVLFLSGASVMACCVALVFFLRFWRRSGDPLFGWFALAFGLMGLNWVFLAMSGPASEFRPFLYLMRLVAYLVIVAAILQKNRPRAL